MHVAFAFIILGFAIACIDRGRRTRRRQKTIERLRNHTPRQPQRFVDLSRFNQDQLLRNRSERWDS